ncbi:MAG TPA: hypothetical protein ENK25_07380 [Bacteroidetes bacterium]|nr:hypothetical protein [Bacteroidota bacterium]
MRFLLSVLISVFIVMTACHSSGSGNKKKESFNIPDSVLNEEKPSMLEEEVTADIIDNLASPVEIAGMLNKLNVPYSNQYLYPARNISGFNTDIQKAFALGVYGADLGYQAMYGQNTAILDYISNIKKLSEDLKVGQFFDFSTLKRLSSNKNNLDSLMFLAVRSFNDIDKYLRGKQRGEVSAMIISGLWLEGMYLATQVQKDYPHPELKERIGEQKIIMEDLFTLLGHYKNNREVKKLNAQLIPLKNLFQQVSITVIPGEPETVEKDGRLVVIQHEESKIDYSEELLQKIILKTKELRNKIVNK